MTKVLNLTHWYNYKPSNGEINKGVSMTEPDQVLSLEKLLQKHTAGGLTMGTQMGYTTDANGIDTPVFGDLQKLDRAGKLQKAKELAKETALLQFELDKQSAAEKEEAEKVRKQKERELLREELKKELTQEK